NRLHGTFLRHRRRKRSAAARSGTATRSREGPDDGGLVRRMAASGRLTSQEGPVKLTVGPHQRRYFVHRSISMVSRMPFIRSTSTPPTIVWTVSIIPTYHVWHPRTLGRPWLLPGWIVLREYGSVAAASASIALRRIARSPHHNT